MYSEILLKWSLRSFKFLEDEIFKRLDKGKATESSMREKVRIRKSGQNEFGF